MSLLRKVDVTLENNAQLDAFHRLRVAPPRTVFSWPGTTGTFNTKIWRTSGSGASTFTTLPDIGGVRLTVSTSGSAPGDTRWLESKEYVPYQAGLSNMFKVTFSYDAAVSNARKRVGLFDSENGVYLEQNASGGISIGMRTNITGTPADTTTAQAAWNIDPMDGSGPSGVDLDWTKSIILVIDYQFLGVGSIRIGFDVDGEFHLAHQINHGNALSSTCYWSRGSLPIRAEVYSTAAIASDADLYFFCAAVHSEGGIEDLGRPYAMPATTSTISVTTRRPIASIALKTVIGASVPCHGLIFPTSVNIYTTGSVVWELVMGGSLTGVSLTSVDSDSVVNYDRSATAITGGFTIASGFLTSGVGSSASAISAAINNAWPFAQGEYLSVVATSLSGTSPCIATLNWLEQQ